MSFTFHPNQPFEWPVTVYLPVDGGHKEFEITGLFEIVDDTDWMKPSGDVNTASDHIEFEIRKLLEVFKGWKPGDILKPDGTPLEVTDAHIRSLLGQRPFRLSVIDAYSAAITPRTGYRAKN